jgi:hypothetical protein
MEEIIVGSSVIFLLDRREYTVTAIYENRIRKADIKDNETGDNVLKVLLDDLILAV